jgi:hypothetical protein
MCTEGRNGHPWVCRKQRPEGVRVAVENFREIEREGERVIYIRIDK